MTANQPTPSRGYRPEAEVTEICRDLIRIDTTNYGDGEGPGERKAAELVAELLTDAGLDPDVFESEPGRTMVVARWDGTDRDADPLLVHGHLDVVPANAADWQVDPFSGEVRDGCVWGRGAVDMKEFDAMVLSVVRARRAAAAPPRRPVVLAFTADEEAGGRAGGHWLVDNRPELLAGCTEGIGEVGGFSLTEEGGRRVYLVESGEKGIAWLRLRARGTAGHGSMRQRDNAVTAVAEAVARIGAYQWPIRLTASTRALLDELAVVTGRDVAPNHVERALDDLGAVSRMLSATVRNTANPTMLDAGYKVNVVPGEATAHVDGRFLPGLEEEFLATIDELLGDRVEREFVHHDIALETTFDGDVVDAMRAALTAEDPTAHAVPFLMSGGTDAKAWSRLGIRCFGFTPLRLPPDLDFSAMFHGVDERVPVDALEFGARVLDQFLDRA